MKHKHSPHFFENLHEADTASNNRFKTCVLTFTLICVFMFLWNITKTKAQSRIDTIPVVMMVSDTAENKHQTQSYFNLNEYSPRKKDSFSILDVKDGQLVEIATPMHYQPYIIYGYQLLESYTHGVEDQHHTDPSAICIGCTKYKTTYLNHLKQPLPQRLIVWMVVRRKTL